MLFSLCALIQGMIDWQQVFVHSDKCQLLNFHFGEGRVTGTILPVLNWRPSHSACWRADSVYTLEPHGWSWPSLLSPCQCRVTQHQQTCSRCPASIWLMYNLGSPQSPMIYKEIGSPWLPSGALGVFKCTNALIEHHCSAVCLATSIPVHFSFLSCLLSKGSLNQIAHSVHQMTVEAYNMPRRCPRYHTLQLKEMAAHSSILTWEIPRTEETGGLQFLGLQRVRHNWGAELTSFAYLLKLWENIKLRCIQQNPS